MKKKRKEIRANGVRINDVLSYILNKKKPFEPVQNRTNHLLQLKLLMCEKVRIRLEVMSIIGEERKKEHSFRHENLRHMLPGLSIKRE